MIHNTTNDVLWDNPAFPLVDRESRDSARVFDWRVGAAQSVPWSRKVLKYCYIVAISLCFDEMQRTCYFAVRHTPFHVKDTTLIT